MSLPRAHDLIWIADRSALESDDALPEWVSHWRTHLPLVVRHGKRADGAIAVGIRGMTRTQRATAWVAPSAIVRTVTPESLVANPVSLLHSRFISQPPMQSLITFASLKWPWPWGVAGSCAYTMASDIPAMHADSNLDLLMRCDQPESVEAFHELNTTLQQLPCRTDVQIVTPRGSFALDEWLQGGEVQLETGAGSVQVRDPWQSLA
jgi:phosphoribosyl-dephospho-CoA transferase